LEVPRSLENKTGPLEYLKQQRGNEKRIHERMRIESAGKVFRNPSGVRPSGVMRRPDNGKEKIEGKSQINNWREITSEEVH